VRGEVLQQVVQDLEAAGSTPIVTIDNIVN
jgi:hypothetical protein